PRRSDSSESCEPSWFSVSCAQLRVHMEPDHGEHRKAIPAGFLALISCWKSGCSVVALQPRRRARIPLCQHLLAPGPAPVDRDRHLIAFSTMLLDERLRLLQ